MVAKGIDVEALSPRDANARPRPTELKAKATAQLKANKDKEHPPPPPTHVTEPPSDDRKDGAVYQVGKLLGKGGFAICYEGTHAETKKRYALKIVKRQMPAKMEQKFQTELQIHSKMRQVNIVQFYRAFSFEDCTYLVLELCPNGSLMDMVKRRGGLTEPEVRYYTVQIAGAIKYMHSKGVIHRDLKMGNIFLDKHMNAKIGDFGLAALLVTGKDMQTIRRTTLCGTPNYIAPEVLEKGKRGHDHMVDIWSLGIIVFAMLTSKPPFQSSTTDEIYRRARERDYEWPAEEKKYITREAKDLVSAMLEDANIRPDPDIIVQDPFFVTGYMPTPSDMTSKLRERAPEDTKFYDYAPRRDQQYKNFQTLEEMCYKCGVGPWSDTKLIHKPLWKEVAAEETAGLTPVIPLAEGKVYRPFDDWLRENQLQTRFVARPMPQPVERLSQTASLSEDASSSSHRVPSGLLRAPPQSFAAQQRAQHRPAESAVTKASSHTIQTTQSVQTKEIVSTQTSSAARIRTKREIPLGAALSLEGREQATKGTTTRSLRGQVPRSRTLPAAKETTQAVPTKVEVAKPATAKPAIIAKPAATAKPAAAAKPAVKAATATAAAKATARKVSSNEERLSLFSPSEYQEEVPGSGPDVVLGRLRSLQAELERALNSRSMAIVSTKDKTPPTPPIVVQWMDHSNRFGMGYVLNDGSVGCILIPTSDGSSSQEMMPQACLLVHNAERHALRKHDPTYPDRHQMMPMSEGIYFYENHGEEGISRVRVDAERFRLSVNAAGTAKMPAPQDVYGRRKQERVALLRKFVNYMVTNGERSSTDELPIAVPTITDPTAVPTDVVTFFQRFGDVGCWVFCDGHMQFNFPDHTKIVLDATGTWCHFWHLPQEAAEMLAVTGLLEAEALYERSLLSYPLQTLLNFGMTSKATMRSASNNPSRRRPEIPADLQGVPAANDFRRKIEFIRDVVREWVANDGIGNGDTSREGRLRWGGVRVTQNVKIPAQHVWVTIGARGGDHRLSALVDPRKPLVLGSDIDESAKKRRA